MRNSFKVLENHDKLLKYVLTDYIDSHSPQFFFYNLYTKYRLVSENLIFRKLKSTNDAHFFLHF